MGTVINDFNYVLKLVDKFNVRYLDDPNFSLMPSYPLPIFGSDISDHMIPELRSLATYFENFSYNQKVNLYQWDTQNNDQVDINNGIVYLYNNDFKYGTLRIRKPGLYILQENILFHPNPDNDFMPKYNQFNQYPFDGGRTGSYHLGFFATITIETSGVILDLNNYTIRQSNIHYLQQRFHAVIELASAPFITGQGPGNFGNEISRATSCMIRNSTIGLSSHHGIHGNYASGIMLQNLRFENNDLAGISLNGTSNLILDNINVANTTPNVPVLGNYSQARFARHWLNKSVQDASDNSLNIIIDGLTLSQIESQLLSSLDAAKNTVINKLTWGVDTPLTDSSAQLFINPRPNTGLHGNVYGIALNRKGVLTGGFLDSVPSDASLNEHNNNILLYDVSISNIESHPVEIISLKEISSNIVQKGAAGDVLNINKVDVSGVYQGNVFSNTQIGIASTIIPDHPDLSGSKGTTSINQEIVAWAEPSGNFADISHNYSYVFGEDLMAHVMKGNAGLFLSGAYKAKIVNVAIDKVSVFGTDVSGQGGDAYGILLAASKNIEFINTNTCNITTESNNRASGTFYLDKNGLSVDISGVDNITYCI